MRRLRILYASGETSAQPEVYSWLLSMPIVGATEKESTDHVPDLLSRTDIDVFIVDGLTQQDVERLGACLTDAMPPPIIALTVSSEFAVRAYEIGIADYVIPPITKYRLSTALQRALLRLESPRTSLRRLHDPASILSEAPERQPRDPARVSSSLRDRIAIKEKGGHLKFLETSKIFWVEAAGNYVILHAEDTSHMVHTTIKNILDHLDGRRFVRVHRSRIVNVEKVRSLSHDRYGAYSINLKNGATITSSRGCRDQLFHALGLAQL
jgi:two-component system LytT family response regulator